MSFQSIATTFINLGIPVFPLSPGTKIPPAGFPFLSEASTNPAKVNDWNNTNPDYNVALLANDEFCFLEFDVEKGFSKAAKQMGEVVPETRTQQSGKGFAHYIFRHTERSRALGNRSANVREACVCKTQDNAPCTREDCGAGGKHHHHEWFSFRAHNKYLVGAGSKHPNGKLYKTYRDVAPLPVPDWVLDFVAMNTKAAKPKVKPSELSSVSEDFDFDEFCEHYGITISHIKDGVWHVVEECPGVGYRHCGSTETGFYFDDGTLGWSCFAQGCPTCGIGIGGLIKFLNADHEPYRGAIWEQESDEELFEDDNIEFVDELDEAGLDEEAKELITSGVTAEELDLILNSEITEEEFTRKFRSIKSLDGLVVMEAPAKVEQPAKAKASDCFNPYAKVPMVTIDSPEQQRIIKQLEKVAQEEAEREAQEEAQEAKEQEIVEGKKPKYTEMGKEINSDGDTLQLVTRCASDFTMTKMSWLWPNRIPSGKITLMTGKPDCGKTLVLLDLCARVSNGDDFADGEKNIYGARKVLVAASEDDPADTLIPRLAAAGANLDNIHIIWGTRYKPCKEGKKKKTGKRTLDLKRDSKMLLDAVKSTPDIALLALDPITSYFGEADQNKDKDIRPVMDAIAALCQKSGITVVGLIHSNKRSDVDAVQKVLGASAVAGSARAVWGYSRDPEDKTKYTMALVKGNLAKKRSGMEYGIKEAMVDIQGEMVGVPHVVWGEEVESDANDILAAERQRAKDGGQGGDLKVIQAGAIIHSMIPCQARKVFEKAEKEGISEDTVKRARRRMDVEARQQPKGPWWWFKTGDPLPWLEAPEVNTGHLSDLD